MANERPLLAVLIDGDNASPKFATAIFEEVASFGEAAVRRVYGDFTSPHLAGWRKLLSHFAIQPVDTPAYTVNKNSSDMAMAIDAMNLLHTGRFDGFVIVSSDSDFTRLASRIRENGVDVFGFGTQSTNEAFRNACKRFLYVETLGGEDIIVAKSDNQSANASSAIAAPQIDTPSKQNSDPVTLLPRTKVVPLVLKAMKSIDPDGTWYRLGHVGNVSIGANPDFDPRNYGHTKLSDLLIKTGTFDVELRDGNDTAVRRKS